MDGLIKSLYIGGGAFLGANARYWVGSWIQSRLSTSFPWQTMLINISGSLLIGIFMEMALREGWNANWKLFVAVGILGGYTTYSTFAYETVGMLSERSFGWAAGYVFGSAVFCVVGAWIGRLGARLILGG